jgi:hypothetical protein
MPIPFDAIHDDIDGRDICRLTPQRGVGVR